MARLIRDDPRDSLRWDPLPARDRAPVGLLARRVRHRCVGGHDTARGALLDAPDVQLQLAVRPARAAARVPVGLRVGGDAHRRRSEGVRGAPDADAQDVLRADGAGVRALCGADTV